MTDNYITWSDEKSFKQALAQFSSNIEKHGCYRGNISRANRDGSTYQRSFIDAETNLSIRDEFNRADYNYYRSGETIPKTIEGRIRLSGEIYNQEGIVKNVIDMMADFAMQGIQVQHRNDKEQRFYTKWFEKVNGIERSERFMNHLFKLGNVVVKRKMGRLKPSVEKDWNNTYGDNILLPDPIIKGQIPIGYSFLNPLSIEVVGGSVATFAGHAMYALKIPTQLKNDLVKILREPKKYKAILDKIPQEIKNMVNKNENILLLDPNEVKVFHHRKDDWEKWGNSIVACILQDLMLYTKMKLADSAALDGAISTVRLWNLGNIEHKILPSAAAFNALRDILANVGNGTLDLVWGPELTFKESDSKVHQFLGHEKYQSVLNSIYSGLGIPRSLTDSSGSGTSFSNNFMALKTLTERLAYGRGILTDFWREELKLVQKAMGFTTPAYIVFDKPILTDEVAEKELIIKLWDRDLIPADTVLEKFGYIPVVQKGRVVKESKRRSSKKLPPKASPFHNPQIDQNLEANLTLEKEKAKNKPATTKPFGGSTKKPQEKPQGGRPKNAKDKKRRKTRVTPFVGKSDFSTAIIWANSAQDEIHNLISKNMLNKFGKKNFRELTKAEIAEFENARYSILSSLEVYSKIVPEMVYNILDSNIVVNTNYQSKYNQLVDEFKSKSNKNPSMDERKQLQSNACILTKMENENVND